MQEHGIRIMMTLWFIIMFGSMIIVSSKTGVTGYLWPKNPPKFEFNKTNIPSFVVCMYFTVVLSALLALFFSHDIAAAGIYVLMNGAPMAYCLTCVLLLKEKD